MNTTDCEVGDCYNGSTLFLLARIAFSLVTSFIAILGNSFVIYAGLKLENRGPFPYLDSAVKSLAMTDLLFGSVGTPINYLTAYLGRYTVYIA